MEFLRLSEEVSLKLLQGDDDVEGFDAITKFETYNDYPKAASKNAQTALNWAEKNGWGSCGTPVGKKRANQLAKGDNISRDTIARMAAFERHRKNSKKELGDGCGRLMWLAWGGDEGVAWAQRKLKQIDNEKMSACGCFSTNEDTNFFAGMGEPESDYEVLDSFDINFKEDGSPINFATEQQGIIQRILTLILTNPLIASSGIAEALGLDFEQLISSMSVLKKSNLIEIEGSTIGLTPVGDRVAKAIDVPQTEVKYRYELRKNAPALKPGGKSRKFCDDLMQTPTQLYTREQIDAMNNKMKKSGYSKVADVWLARGGWYRRIGTETSIPFCRHIWKQVIVRKK
jgi:hypothetical protein